MGRAAAALALAGLAAAGPTSARFDLVIAGGTIVDGTGAPGFRADLGVADGAIAAIGRFRPEDARRTIDATGLVVAPGFIAVDPDPNPLALSPAALDFVRNGVTTVVSGADGASALDVSDALARLRDETIAVNAATLAGQGTIHRAVMGTSNRLPTPPELARMKSLVWKAMADGAIGLSTGSRDSAGASATLPELVELARVVANAGGVYVAGARAAASRPDMVAAEAIRIGDIAGARVEIRPPAASAARRGWSAALLQSIDDARRSGVDVSAEAQVAGAGDEDLQRILLDPRVTIAGGELRLMSVYLRQRKLIDVETAVRRMSAVPATRYRLAGRGTLQPGGAADVIVFDPASIGSSSGMIDVLVNGVIVREHGTATGARPGQVIAKSLLLRP